MSIRRTQQTVENLWRAMEAQLPQPQPNGRHHQGHQCNRARASPPPDPEAGSRHLHDGSALPQFTAQAMQPPRLQQASCCSRVLLMGGCCMCLVVVLVAWTAFISLPAVVEARDIFSDSLAQAASPGGTKRPLPAVLHRFAMIRRVQKGQGRGADDQTLRQAFPHWRDAQGNLMTEAVVSDMAMGIAAVVEHLDPSMVENRATLSFGGLPGAGVAPELLVANAQSAQDTESTEL